MFERVEETLPDAVVPFLCEVEQGRRREVDEHQRHGAGFAAAADLFGDSPPVWRPGAETPSGH